MLILTQALWGVYRRARQPQTAMPLELELAARHAEQLVWRRRVELFGRIRARALGAEREAAGSLRLGSRAAPFRYELEFRGWGSQWCRLTAEVFADWKRPLLSLSTLTGTLDAEGRCYEVELRYDYRRDLRGLLRWETCSD